MDNTLLKMTGINKVFPGVHALQDVDLRVDKGEVLAVIGENGAGKSTLIKTISGAYSPTSGEIEFEGKKLDRITPETSIHMGIAVIYQELNYLNFLSVAENIFLGTLPKKGLGVDWKKLREDSAAVQAQVGLAYLDPMTNVGSLSTAEKQLVEIARAYARNLKLIIMDEPTSALNEEETNRLFSLIEKMRSEGKSVIFITHKLDEIYKVASRVIVMRDGRTVFEGPLPETGKDTIIREMVGREIEDMYPVGERTIGEPILEVNNLSGHEKVKHVSLVVHKGEIVGLYGLMGCGASEIAQSIFGAQKITEGSIKVDGKEVSIKNPVEAIQAGLAYVPSERKSEGLVLIHSVESNTSIVTLGEYKNGPFLSGAKEAKVAREWVEQLGIKTPSIKTIVESLSGGNQQKVVFAKWCAADPKVFIMNDPTKGVDVGAKVEIYKEIETLCRSGCGTLVVGSELPELIGICDRIYVIYNGEIAGECSGDGITQENIIKYAIGEKKDERE